MLDRNYHSSYTISLDMLVDRISGVDHDRPSLYQQAADYFRNEPANRQKLAHFKTQIAELTASLATLTGKNERSAEQQIDQLKRQYERERAGQQKVRVKRLNDAIDLCLDILSLSEGDNFDETQSKSSRFLTTLVLFSPEKSANLAELHHGLKPAYKALLSLRLLDKLVTDGLVKNAYMMEHYDPKKRYEPESSNYICYTQSVILPVMLAAIFQDVGLQHPDLVELLQGEEGEKDRFRLLENDEREKMLRLNYQYTVDYLQNGLGVQQAAADSTEDIKAFEQAEQKRLKFLSGLVIDANSAKLGTSEVIKIPQIYASVIFSTKRDYNRRSLGTASLLIEQLAVKKTISSQVASAFVDIVGHFPLGYGIVYISKDLKGNEQESYEYAIVSRLNPSKPDEPICRLVSKNLMFVAYAKTVVIEKDINLHFPVARKKLVKIDPKRLTEIMQKLTDNFRPEDSKAFIPYYWEPHEYFFIQGNQNLWNA